MRHPKKLKMNSLLPVRELTSALSSLAAKALGDAESYTKISCKGTEYNEMKKIILEKLGLVKNALPEIGTDLDVPDNGAENFDLGPEISCDWDCSERKIKEII